MKFQSRKVLRHNCIDSWINVPENLDGFILSSQTSACTSSQRISGCTYPQTLRHLLSFCAKNIITLFGNLVIRQVVTVPFPLTRLYCRVDKCPAAHLGRACHQPFVNLDTNSKQG